MYAFLTSSLFLCVVVSLAAYAIGVYLHNKLENDLVNPLLIAIALVLVFLLVTGLPYKDYMKGPAISASSSHRPPSVWRCRCTNR